MHKTNINIHHNIYYSYSSEFRLCYNIVFLCFSCSVLFLFYPLFVMGKYIGKFYKNSQYQLSTLSFKAPVCSSPDSQTSSSIKLTTASVPYVRGGKDNNYVLCSKNSIPNDVSITNNNDIQSCETERKTII